MKIRTLFFGIVLFDVLMISLAVAMGIWEGDPHEHFGEKRLITFLSVIQLLIISRLSYMILEVRRPADKKITWQSPAAIWAIISFGFLFLALDDFFGLHESIDHRIHDIFRIVETGLTDRLDDLLVGLYGIIGIFVLYVYRGEIWQFKPMLRFLGFGFIFMFVMVILDTLTQRIDILSNFMETGQAITVKVWLSIAEETAKIFAGSLFLLGFYKALQLADPVSATNIFKINFAWLSRKNRNN